MMNSKSKSSESQNDKQLTSSDKFKTTDPNPHAPTTQTAKLVSEMPSYTNEKTQFVIKIS